MILWVDAQLSPTLAPWITEQFGTEAYSVKWLGYRDATDREIFHAARAAGAVVMCLGAMRCTDIDCNRAASSAATA